MKNISLCTALSALAAAHSFAQALADKTDIWGASPTATDDRFSNPKSKLYAGPDGWWNAGEVRANVGTGADAKAFKFRGTFRVISGQTIAVKDSQTLLFDFDSEAKPKPGVYKIGSKGNPAQQTVKLAFADVGNSRILEWSSGDGAGTLTVTSVHGFLYVTTRNVTLKPSGLSNQGEWATPLTLGGEGAMKIE